MSVQPTSFSRTERNVVPFRFGGDHAEPLPWRPTEHTAPRPSPPERTQPEPEADPREAAWAQREAELLAEVQAAYAKGQEDAQAEAAAERGAAAEQLGQAAVALDAAAAALEAKYRGEAIELALSVARAVVGETLSVDDDALMGVVDRALAMVPRADQVMVRANPEDFDRMRILVADAAARRGDPSLVRVVSSPGVERSGVVIDFESGSVDAGPTVAMELMREAIETALAGRHDQPEPEAAPEDALDPSHAEDDQ